METQRAQPPVRSHRFAGLAAQWPHTAAASLPLVISHNAIDAGLGAHFAEPLRVEQVAASVFLSPDRFTKVFARTMGRTPRDYIRHLRVERARLLLATTGLSVSEVGQAAASARPPTSPASSAPPPAPPPASSGAGRSQGNINE